MSFWSYSQVSFSLLFPFLGNVLCIQQEAIDGRDQECEYYPDSCKDEAWFMREVNAQLREKFDQEKNFTFCFTDSWSQTAGHVDKPTEQEHWAEETDKLWEVTTNRTSEFSFRTIDDILEENAAQKEQIRWLNEVITNNISELSGRIQDNVEDIAVIIEDVSSVR